MKLRDSRWYQKSPKFIVILIVIFMINLLLIHSHKKQTNTERFDWNEFKGDEIVRSTRAVIVYLNPDNDIVIRQEAPMYTDEEPFILIPSASVPKLIEKLKQLSEAH